MEETVRKFQLRDSREQLGASRKGPPSWLVPLLPLVFLGATLAGIWVVKRGPVELFGGLVVISIVIGFGWILASVLLPSAPVDRSCPNCGHADGLRPAFEDTTRGVACRACDYMDETASAWLIAEEDGPLEPVVLRERAARRRGNTSRAQDGEDVR